MNALLCLLLLVSPALAGPEQDLIELIRKELPAEASILADSNIARSQLERTDKLEYAVELKHFAPFKLVKVRYMDPAAGPPGIVLDDLRVLYHPELGRFAVASLDWVRDHRTAHPLDVTKLDDEALIAYILELVALVPRADRWGFAISELRRDGLTVHFRFEQPDDMNRVEGHKRAQTWTFTQSGAVAEAPWLKRAFPVD